MQDFFVIYSYFGKFEFLKKDYLPKIRLLYAFILTLSAACDKVVAENLYKKE